jgi:signal transduction histidine kinase
LDDLPERFPWYFQTMFHRRALDLSLGCAVAAFAAWFLPHDLFPAGAVVLLAGAVGLMWRHPYVALCLGIAANIVCGLTYEPLPLPENEWNVAVAIVISTSLGTFLAPPRAYSAVVVVAASVAVLQQSAMLENWVWVSAMMSCVATFAALVTRSGRRARSAWTRMEELAATTPEMVARRAVAEERIRLTTDIHLVIRASVLSMRTHADAAARAWQTDPRESLQAIQERGRQAISELRRLLGLLRDESDKDPVDDEPVADKRKRHSLLVDVLGTLGAVTLATAEYYAWGQYAPQAAPVPSLTFTILAAATFVLRGMAPGAGAALCGAVFLAGALSGHPLAPGIWCFAVVGALPWTALYRAKPVDIAGVAAMLGCQIVYSLLIAPDDLTLLVFIVVAAGAGGFLTARRNTVIRLAAARTARILRERAIATERAVRSERLTLARELHDVVSHAVVLMVVQAGAAEALLRGRPGEARAALELIRNTATVTLAELDRLRAVVRGESAIGPDTRSLRALVERMRAGGLDIDFDQKGDAPSATVYRIVQETLTNALRHAPRAHVLVRVASHVDGITVEIVDDGPGACTEAHRGYGLIGMTERVRHAGGTIFAGPGSDGTGFRVCANLPATDGSVT